MPNYNTVSGVGEQDLAPFTMVTFVSSEQQLFEVSSNCSSADLLFVGIVLSWFGKSLILCLSQYLECGCG